MIMKLALAGLTGFVIYKGVQIYGTPRAYAGNGPNELAGNLPLASHEAMRASPPADTAQPAPVGDIQAT